MDNHIGYLLDTDVLSNEHKLRPLPGVSAWLAGMNPAQLHVSCISITEILTGIARGLGNPDGLVMPERDIRFLSRLSDWVQSELITGGRGAVLPICMRSAIVLGQMYSDRSLVHSFHGTPGSAPRYGFDLAIAATAIANNLAVATNNVRDYLEISRAFPLPGLYDVRNATWVIGPPPRMGGQSPSNDPGAAHGPLVDGSLIRALRRRETEESVQAALEGLGGFSLPVMAFAELVADTQRTIASAPAEQPRLEAFERRFVSDYGHMALPFGEKAAVMLAEHSALPVHRDLLAESVLNPRRRGRYTIWTAAQSEAHGMPVVTLDPSRYQALASERPALPAPISVHVDRDTRPPSPFQSPYAA